VDEDGEVGKKRIGSGTGEVMVKSDRGTRMQERKREDVSLRHWGQWQMA
jgi:hypothetical protein